MSGRRTSLTKGKARQICDQVRSGSSVKIAAPACGVSWNTAKEWLSKGRQGLEPYARFAEDVERAKAAWATLMIRMVSSAGGKDWRAAAYLLERRIPGFYRPDQRPDDDRGGERVILMYPVPMPLGAEPLPLARLPGQVFETDGE